MPRRPRLRRAPLHRARRVRRGLPQWIAPRVCSQPLPSPPRVLALLPPWHPPALVPHPHIAALPWPAACPSPRAPVPLRRRPWREWRHAVPPRPVLPLPPSRPPVWRFSQPDPRSRWPGSQPSLRPALRPSRRLARLKFADTCLRSCFPDVRRRARRWRTALRQTRGGSVGQPPWPQRPRAQPPSPRVPWPLHSPCLPPQPFEHRTPAFVCSLPLASLPLLA
mmetsp:Transcript_36157/g.83918  ORF Transcript_36157/g.83918 Transcript_36157/m.83918 type:complete len:222 (-) Transcript_36157:125-790(-)